jgi:hypothetical protein
MLNRSDIIKAFSAKGIQLIHMGRTAGVDDYVNASFVEVRSPEDPWLEVEIFPTLRSAHLVQSVGGNITGTDGRLVPPLAVIRNVVITRFETATKSQRAKALQAVRLLRRRG